LGRQFILERMNVVVLKETLGIGLRLCEIARQPRQTGNRQQEGPVLL